MPGQDEHNDPFIRRVKDCIERYDMVKDGDLIMCAASGGKDSAALLVAMSELFPGRVRALTFNPHIPEYSDTNLSNLRALCDSRNIALTEVSLKEKHDVTLSELRDRLGSSAPTYCTICGVLKRYYLNLYARREGATIIATGHNMDDVVQSHLMNILRGTPSASARLGPISGVTKDSRFIRRVKPLMMIAEHEILGYVHELGVLVDTSPCPYSGDAYRRTVKEALDRYEKASPGMHERVLGRFLSDLGRLQALCSTGEAPAACTICGEPCQQDICSACHLLKKAGLLERC